MPRKRKPENNGLPPRWIRHHGAYYYCVPKGFESHWNGKQRFQLGKTLAQAHRAWAARVERQETPRTVSQLLDRYEVEVIPTKAPATQVSNLAALVHLRAVFGRMEVESVRPSDAYQYRDKRGKKAPTAANRELEVLSHAFTKAVQWGALDVHPMIRGGFRKLETPSRDRYIEDWEWAEILSLKPRRKRGSVRMLLAYITARLLTGRRRVEMLKLREEDLLEDGIRFHVAKRKRRQTSVPATLVVEWSPELRAAIEAAKAARPVDICPWIFCDYRGRSYIGDDGQVKDGWDSLWQRFVARVLKETKVKERFTDHDIRAKAASDLESLERARELLAHASAQTTQRVYRRRPPRVKPLR